MRKSLRLFVNGFVAQCEGTVVENLSRLSGVEHIFWLRDFVGSNDVIPNPNVKILDSVEILHVKVPGADKAEAIAGLPPDIQDCFHAIRPATLKMMDRVERYGPVVRLAKREDIFVNNFLYCFNLIESEGINGFVSTGVPHEITDFIFGEICRVKGIRTLIFYQVQTDLISTISHYSELGRGGVNVRGELKEEELALRNEVLKRLRHQFRPDETDEPVAHFYMGADSRKKVSQQTTTARRRRIRGKMNKPFRKLFSRSSWRYAYYLLYEKRFAEKKRTKKLWENYHNKCSAPDPVKEDYVLLFLHYQPELTTSPLAETFVDQYKIAHLLINALPAGLKLYVKEHPAQRIVGRTLDYYDQFPQDDRLIFIDENFSSAKLQNNAVAIATCTGTAGFEAIWKKTPVLVFGNAYYQNGPNVFRIDREEDAREVLLSIVEQSPAVSNGEVDGFVNELIDRCRVGNLSDPYFWNSQLGFDPEKNSEIILSEIDAWINLNWPETGGRNSLQ